MRDDLVNNQNQMDDISLNHANRWLKDHQNLSPKDLEKLGNEHSFMALEALRELADTYNVSYDSTTRAHELADRISIAMDQGSA
ncbi:MAG TPA: hypothetical protein VGQ87_02360 [Patescibacteria group bacterium]|jgi:hypothetical protein|nr:hypothetical protein [Patescibacteria group bacterium]